MITGSQIRAAKALLDWTGNDLASKAGVSLSSIRRVEALDDVPKNVSVNTMLNIQKALEQAGVEFIGNPDHQPGVRLK